MKILCVTSCFSGIVSTYLAAEALHLAGEQLGLEIVVETQGPAGTEPFVGSDFESADGVVFAVEVPVVGRDRFVGMPYLDGRISPAIHAPRELLNQLVAQISDGTAIFVAAEPPAADNSAVTVDSSSERGFLAKLFGRARRK
jgi:PTS system fructose-specific IIC component